MTLKTLQLVIVFVVCSGFSALPAHSQDSSNTFHNEVVGLTVTKPDSWHFVSKQETAQNRRNTRLKDEELQRNIQEKANLPTIAVARYPHPHPTVNPTVQIVTRSNLQPDMSATVWLEKILPTLERGYKDFAVTRAVHDTTISGLPAAHMRGTFTMENKEGATFDVLTRMWLVPRGEQLFIVGMSGPAEGRNVSEKQFRAILKSVNIRH